MKRTAFIAFLLLISITTFAQKNIKGIISGTDGKAIENVTVAYLESVSNSIIITALSDNLGHFELKRVPKESYLYVSLIGYKPQKVKVESTSSDINITLQNDPAFVLDEVVVKGHHRIVKLKGDRIVYDMASSPLKDENALQALKFVPLVVTKDEEFSIIGKGRTEVYINGRKSQLTSDALVSYLKTLPANSIKNIEVITTPNSTFRGEGNFGILNIQLKKSESDGLRAVLSGQISKTHYFKENAAVSFSYKKGKLVTDFLAGVMNGSDWKNNTMNAVYTYNKLNTSANTITDGHNQGYFANFSADYELNKKQTIGVIVNTSIGKRNWSEGGVTRFAHSVSNVVDSLKSIDYQSDMNEHEVAINANYRRTFDRLNQYIHLDADYLNNYSKMKSVNVMNYLNKDESVHSLFRNFVENVPQKNNIWSMKAEYGCNPTPTSSITIGLDSYHSKIDNDDKYQSWQNNLYVDDLSQSNHFALNEWTSAVSFYAEKTWNKQFSTSVGSRLEYTSYKGTQYTSGENFKNDYFRFLPTFYLTYSPTDNHSFSYDLSYRIARPGFSFLNPFKIYASPTLYATGNPYLNPSKHFAQNLGYTLFGKYTFKASYETIDGLVKGFQVVKENNMIEAKPFNIDKVQQFILMSDFQQNYWKGRGAFTLSCSYNWQSLKERTEELNLNYHNNYVNVYMNNRLVLSKRKNLSFDLGLNYYTKQKYANKETPESLDINAQLKKRIKMWQVSLYYNQSLCNLNNKWGQTSGITYITDALQTSRTMRGEASCIGVRFAYMFGNMKVKGMKERQTSTVEAKKRLSAH